ncbi:hypothetical protein AT268_31590 [Bacillus cereus]|uniref:Uncharacterized protein n=1 Tax=Bacillus cereus TaxID=1396 RepID=A0A9X0SQ85_BACCE|nr:hypothetical protein [Bacillus cereus]KXY51048.1 hypothetical protein AT268_31590 [Bacillus cereus]
MRDLFLVEVKHDEFMFNGKEFQLMQENVISNDQYLAYVENTEDIKALLVEHQPHYYYELPNNPLPGDSEYQSQICSVTDISDDGGSPLLQSFSQLDSFLFKVAQGKNAVIKMR